MAHKAFAIDDRNFIVLDVENLTLSRAALPSSQIPDDIARRLAMVEESFGQASSTSASIPTVATPEPTLGRLTLVLLNKCNLACTYCYEEEGTFGLTQTFSMSLATAIAGIDAIYNAYQSVDNIMFFGGEPMLAHRLVPEICDHVLERCASRNMPTPHFGIITNGTVLNDEILATLKKYEIGLTVSVDGPKEIHDFARVKKSGKGTYDLVKKNFARIQGNGIPVGIQATVMDEHIGLGATVSGIANHFADEFGVDTPHITPAGRFDDNITKGDIASLYTRATEEFLESIEAGAPRGKFSFAEGMLRSLILRQQNLYTCPAGFELALDPKGDIYPCFMFVGDPAHVLGSVAGGISDDFWERWDGFMAKSLKEQRLGCSTCWARNLCHGCMGGNEDVTGSVACNPKYHCQIIKGMSETIIRYVTDLATDRDRMQRFIVGYRQVVGATQTNVC